MTHAKQVSSGCEIS